MSDPLSNDPEADAVLESLVAEATDDYLERLERGERPNLEEYGRRYPQIADVLEQVLPAVEAMRLSGQADQAAGSPELAAPLGSLGDFRLLRQVGHGGMGIVYEAEQISLSRRVALKVLPFAAALDPKRLERFRHEAQAAAHLHHTHIVPVFAVGCERGVYYYAMQFIEGQSLAEVIEELRRRSSPPSTSGAVAIGGGQNASERGPASAASAISGNWSGGVEHTDGLSEPQDAPATIETKTHPTSSTIYAGNGQAFMNTVVQWAIQAAEALKHAHSLGVVHRDIKPANLLIDVRDHLWVTDFGLAQYSTDTGLTVTGDLVGTLRYMSPEQALGERGMVDHRTDIYALAATFYELLTLRPLLDGSNREELLEQVLAESPVPPRRLNKAIPVDLETILLKALARDPADRYGSAGALADDLRRLLAHEPIRAKRPSLVERASKWSRRHRPVVFSAIVVLLVGVVALAASTALVLREQARTNAAYARLVREQQATKAAYESAARERAQAEKDFQRARQMLDFFTQVCAEELPERPDNNPVRTKLLQAALDYYEGFIQQSSGNRHLQAELANSHQRVAEILHQSGSTPAAVVALEQACALQEDLLRKHPEIYELRFGLFWLYYRLGVFRGQDLIFFASQDSVRKHLGLSAEQVEAVGRLPADQFSLFTAARDRQDPAEVRQLFQEQAAKARSAIAKILSPEQLRRLEQISLQRRGTLAFSDPMIIAAMQLTDEQAKVAQQVQKEAADAFSGPPRQSGGGGDRPRPPDYQKKILDTLSPEQRAKWHEMTGEEFTGEIHFPWPNAPGGQDSNGQAAPREKTP